MIVRRFLSLCLVCLLASCTIPITGERELKNQASTIIVGTTSVSELRAKLGKPKMDAVVSGRHYLRWDFVKMEIAPATVIPIVGSLIDDNAGTYQWLSIEAGQGGIVKRKLFYETTRKIHQSLQKLQIGTPYEIINNTELYRHAKTSAELVSVLGEPFMKELSPRGEKWAWVGMERGFVNNKGMITALIDSQGRSLEIWRKID